MWKYLIKVSNNSLISLKWEAINGLPSLNSLVRLAKPLFPPRENPFRQFRHQSTSGISAKTFVSTSFPQTLSVE